jgi:hypothetical protein
MGVAAVRATVAIMVVATRIATVAATEITKGTVAISADRLNARHER